MRRIILSCVVLLVGMTGVIVYTGLTEEREFQRLIADGDRAAAAGQAFLAIEAYSGALALRPNSMVVHLKRGEVYQRQADLESATRDLSLAATLDPTATRPLERLGDVSATRSAFDQAIEHYTGYLRLDDQNANVVYKLALANQRAGRVARAVPLLRRAIELDSGFAEAYYLLGLCLHEQDRLEEARTTLETAVALSPGFLEAREVLAAVYRSLGDERPELEQLDALAALDRGRPQRHVSRSLAYARAGQVELAVLALGRAADEHPDQPLVYEALGQVWLEIAETRQDRVALGKALEALSSIPSGAASSGALVLLSRARLLEGDTAVERETLRAAVRRFPVEPDAFLRLARLEERDGRRTEASLLRRQYAALTATTPDTSGQQEPEDVTPAP